MRTPTVAVIVGLALTFAAATAEAQWEVSTSEPDDFTGAVIGAVYVLGESGNIFLSVYCDNSVVLRLSGRSRGGIFHHGKVETRWDDGEVEVFEFEDQDDRLSLNGGRSNRLINGFRQRNFRAPDIRL